MEELTYLDIGPNSDLRLNQRPQIYLDTEKTVYAEVEHKTGLDVPESTVDFHDIGNDRKPYI